MRIGGELITRDVSLSVHHRHFPLTVVYVVRKIIKLRKSADDWQFHCELTIKFLGSEKRSLTSIKEESYFLDHSTSQHFFSTIPLCARKKNLRIEGDCHNHFLRDKRKKKKKIFGSEKFLSQIGDHCETVRHWQFH